tara:strand:- start:2435 stop:2788 length:354 start_codon:yes stop_codon:yes gene_type:complete
MIRLKPIQTSQLLRILPRTSDVITGAVAHIKNEETGSIETLSNLSNSVVNGFTHVIIEALNLEEDTTYSLEMTHNGELWYRDKIYVTSSETTEKYHNIQKDTYTSPAINEDNEYSIL